MTTLRRVRLPLAGQLTRAKLDAGFFEVARAIAAAPGGFALVVDCRSMTGYDGEARERFVEWNRDNRARLAAVAVLTDKRLWHMIVGTMSLASGQRMRAFASETDANAWLDALPGA